MRMREGAPKESREERLLRVASLIWDKAHNSAVAEGCGKSLEGAPGRDVCACTPARPRIGCMDVICTHTHIDVSHIEYGSACTPASYNKNAHASRHRNVCN